MRVKYLAGKIRRDFFQFDGLPTGSRSEQTGGGTGAAQADRRRITGGGAAEAGRGFVGGLFSWAAGGLLQHRQKHHPQEQTAPPPAPPPGQHRQTITGGDGGRPPPAPAEREAEEDGHRGGTGCRTAATACRIAAPKGFTRTVSSLYPVYQRPPYSPPRALQALPCNPAKSTATARHSRPQQRTEEQHSRPPDIQHRHRLQPQSSQPTGQQPHTAQPAATNQRARARF